MTDTPIADTEIQIVANGIDADTGCPLPAISREAVIAAAQDNLVGDVDQAKRKAPPVASMPGASPKAVVGDFDPDELKSVGWGVVFPAGRDNAALHQALGPLLDRRKDQAGNRYFVFDGDLGVKRGETPTAWLSRQGRGPSLESVDPDYGVPFYLLIVADSTEVSMEFQYLLDMFWAVGRLHFDEVQEYAQYAKSVVAAETGAPPATQTAAIFATEHPFDAATMLFTRDVAKPFAFGNADKPNLVANLDIAIDPILGKDATKAAFAELLRGNRTCGTPSVLLSGTHGMAFNQSDGRLASTNGALICQDWQGYGQVNEGHWFAASHVPPDARVHGMIYVLFACYGGGWSEHDTFRDNPDGTAKKIAPGPGISKLPQALLSHSNGGALAVLAHIDRAWSYSFRTASNNPQNTGLRDVLRRLLKGERIGLATDQFNLRWAAAAVKLSDALRDDPTAPQTQTAELARLWVQRDDARNYIVMGDPAVRVKRPGMSVA
ncbi:C25 family cysteine peptidase [Rhizobium hidalgonense]|uniref:C25 family cysteine peptidase n=1 Tax=Rhizobium hidalgonense TaxID=1538159 RepID=UPI0013E30B1F|nr:C25 family cysteine peptidase [Rhizobium hidalgonense]